MDYRYVVIGSIIMLLGVAFAVIGGHVIGLGIATSAPPPLTTGPTTGHITLHDAVRRIIDRDPRFAKVTYSIDGRWVHVGGEVAHHNDKFDLQVLLGTNLAPNSNIKPAAITFEGLRYTDESIQRLEDGHVYETDKEGRLMDISPKDTLRWDHAAGSLMPPQAKTATGDVIRIDPSLRDKPSGTASGLQ